jgi:type III pantothenate kinase
VVDRTAHPRRKHESEPLSVVPLSLRKRAAAAREYVLAHQCLCPRAPNMAKGQSGFVWGDLAVLLAIDAGNTNIVFAVHDGEHLRGQWRATTHDARTADEHMVWLHQLMQIGDLSPKSINAAIIASVVPQALFGLRTLCSRYLGCEALIIGDPAVKLGLRVAVDQPSEVGADRLIDAVAAHRRYGGPIIIVDFGTATTFDVVDAEGTYHGGVIAPGINLSAEALHKAAAQLPHIAIQRPATVIGKSTLGAMQSGIYWGYISLIEGLITRIKAEFGQEMTVVGTGGLASLFRAGTPVIEHVDRDLTIRGLVHVYEQNSP